MYCTDILLFFMTSYNELVEVVLTFKLQTIDYCLNVSLSECELNPTIRYLVVLKTNVVLPVKYILVHCK